jgi:peptide/nickel transport system substrate-binding protein
MTKKVLLIGLILMVVVMLVAACGEDDTTTTSATPSSTTPTSAPGTTASSAVSTTATTVAAQSDIILNVTPAGQSATTFTYNFNPFTTTYLFPTWAGIYEPLMINNRLGGKLQSWLAKDYKWSDDLLTLTFTLQDGVKWSDNTDFTSTDVVYTFDALRTNDALAGMGKVAVAAGGFVDSVIAPDAKTVEFHFNKVYTPGFYDIINQYIVPEHIWKNVADPATDPNLKPVGTGPFTEVVTMEDQVYEIDRNPYYWQPGQPYVKGLRMPAYSGNEAVATMLVNGDIDWSGQFIANIQKAVLDNNKNVHAWWPATSVQFFMVNGTIKPFDDPVVRKAIGMCFDRNRIIQLANQGSSIPADITGLANEGYVGWKVADLATLGENWATYDVAKANQTLDAAGYAKGADGIRTNKDGTPWKFELPMVNGFTDWLAIAPTLKEELEAIGFSIDVVNYDPGQWFGKLFPGDFQMSMFFGTEADTPYNYYRNIMSQQTFKPVGEPTGFGQNFWRVVVPDAEAPLEKFASTSDSAVQHEAAIELQKIFAANAPVIPLFTAGTFYVWSDAKVSGWADANNQFTRPMPIGQNATSEQLIQMVSWGPKK